MTEDIKDDVVAALEDLVKPLDRLMQLGSDAGDMRLRHLIGRLAAEIAAQIDFDIYPYLQRSPPHAPSD